MCTERYVNHVISVKNEKLWCMIEFLSHQYQEMRRHLIA